MQNPQKIESAPKDGTEILAFREDAGWFVARYGCEADFYDEKEMETMGVDGAGMYDTDWFCADFICCSRLDGDLKPTHWLPMPDCNFDR